ncbi:hypothetical protein AB0F72_08580 [Actinoplanes sp. NPDC023936]|uniref:hypothetical protein n=1 Tax=Actinoplanes sp. NPDC023936 TaxID=3154910 RepID=UPI0033EEDCB5
MSETPAEVAGVEPIPGWNAARQRVLTRYAKQARYSAQRIRGHAVRYGHDLAAVEPECAALERYADACELAAADPNLPTPEYKQIEEAA